MSFRSFFCGKVSLGTEKVSPVVRTLVIEKFPCYTIVNKRKGMRKTHNWNMKYTINKLKQGEEELILNYISMSSEVERILSFMREGGRKLLGFKDDIQVVLNPEEILYVESVDGRTYAYTSEEVYKLSYSLAKAQELLDGINFYRCSKSMIINIDCISALKSLASNRIDAVMKNGEHILISRTYASEFRRRLKGD